MLAVQGALACSDESCIAEEVTLLQGVQVVRSHTNTARLLLTGDYPNQADQIIKGWKPSARARNSFVKSALQIFDFTRGEDYEVVSENHVKITEATSSTSSEVATEIATTFNAAATVKIPAAAFTVAAAASTSSQTRDRVLTVRHVEHSGFVRFTVNNKISVGRMVNFLESKARADFLNVDPATIYRDYGAFYAKALELGGNIMTSIVREVRESERVSSVETSLSASVTTLRAEASASGSLSVSNQATKSSGTTTIKIETSGGDGRIWLSGRDYQAMQQDWSGSLESSNVEVTYVELVPLWELIGDLNAAKGKQFQDYCQTRWLQESADILNAEAERHVAAPAAFDKLEVGKCLASGEELVSSNGHVKLVMQGDGNLVVYNGREFKWSSGTHAPGDAGASACLQDTDGNLVVRNLAGTAIWASGAQDFPDHLVIQNDCNLVMYPSRGRALWASIQDDDGYGC